MIGTVDTNKIAWTLGVMALYPMKGVQKVFTSANTLEYGLLVCKGKEDRLVFSPGMPNRLTLPLPWLEMFTGWGEAINAVVLPLAIHDTQVALWNISAHYPCTGTLYDPYSWAHKLRKKDMFGGLWVSMLIADASRANMSSPEGFSNVPWDVRIPRKLLAQAAKIYQAKPAWESLATIENDVRQTQQTRRAAVLRQMQTLPWVLADPNKADDEEEVMFNANGQVVPYTGEFDSRVMHNDWYKRSQGSRDGALYSAPKDNLLFFSQREKYAVYTKADSRRADTECPHCSRRRYLELDTKAKLATTLPDSEAAIQGMREFSGPCLFWCRYCHNLFATDKRKVIVEAWRRIEPGRQARMQYIVGIKALEENEGSARELVMVYRGEEPQQLPHIAQYRTLKAAIANLCGRVSGRLEGGHGRPCDAVQWYSGAGAYGERAVYTAGDRIWLQGNNSSSVLERVYG